VSDITKQMCTLITREEMEDVAIETRTGRLHWVMHEASNGLCPDGYKQIIPMHDVDDDVAEIMTTFLNYNAIMPLNINSRLIHEGDMHEEEPAWCGELRAALKRSASLRFAVLVQAECRLCFVNLQKFVASCS